MKKLLLQSCCAPCSTHVIDILKSEYQLTIFYYNPNIYPDKEYQKRLSEQKRYANVLGISVIEEKYDEKEFLSFVKGHELDSEGGDRCALCFELRLLKTAEKAKELGFDVFATTLSIRYLKGSGAVKHPEPFLLEKFDTNDFPQWKAFECQYTEPHKPLSKKLLQE